MRPKEVKVNGSRIRLLLAMMFTLLLLAPAGATLAAQPSVESFRLEGSYVLARCGDFQVLADYVEQGRLITFFDKAGNPTKRQWMAHYDGTATHSVTGQTLNDDAHYRYTEDLVNATVESNGLWYGFTLKGRGMSLLVAGRFVHDAETGQILFESGPHQLSNVTAADICALFD